MIEETLEEQYAREDSTFTMEQIGTLNYGIDGKEIYYKIDTKYPAVIDIPSMTEYLKSIYCYESRGPGGKFCDSVHVIHSKYSKSSGIATIFERYDN